MAAAILLPKIAAVATCGSVITAVKTSWELSRMVRKKRAETTIAEDSDEVVQLAEDLQVAYSDGLLTRRERDEWYDRLLTGVAEKDCMAITKVKTHVKLLRQRERASRERSRERSRKSKEGSSRNRDDSRNREPTSSRRRHTVSHHERDQRENSSSPRGSPRQISSPRASRSHRRSASDVTDYGSRRVRFGSSPRKDRDHPQHGDRRDYGSDSERSVQGRPPTPYLLPPPADKPSLPVSPRSRARASTLGGLGITDSPRDEREPVRVGGRKRAVSYASSPVNTEDFFERGRELERGGGARWRDRHSSRCPSDEDDCAACRRDATRRNSNTSN
ncbi:hypothetical protein GGTG_06020 [Gaeumannomyces tritici R3-111a-1]|uniref:Uncharacterized protein n=1 Tax=Gaeumannomyces tritici (strain R3-111a-1) TaxID=644352 RepID=J3NXL4_GAET3|nr:hypothetical protein GGTG_06020 [Gaeumannomyces tritici R3-111a-1]EJT76096.1 hypothetical protein GGTG_06020 [Gaeumannomyces tritici R3-111a-1]